MTDPNSTRYRPNALRLFQPVAFCKNTRMRSKAGAIAMATVNRSGRRKCCSVQKPAFVSSFIVFKTNVVFLDKQ